MPGFIKINVFGNDNESSQKHITWDFNSKSQPSFPKGKEIYDIIDVLVVGAYMGPRMSYLVCEVQVAGEWITHQPNNPTTPLHVTLHVAPGVNPVETGIHAREGAWTKFEEPQYIQGILDEVVFK